MDAPAPLRLWHLVSLGAPTVAVVWTLAFAWAAKVRLPLWVPLLLALVAWAVYIGDRLLDARAALQLGAPHRLRERHLFHWRHRRILLPIAAASACAATWIVLTLMPAGVRQRDSMLGAVAVAYFSGVHSSRRVASQLPRWLKPFFSKELLVGILFTAACVLPIWNRAPADRLLLPPIYFAALAWLNCHAIDRWESGTVSPRTPGIVAGGILLGLAGLLLAEFLFTGNQFHATALMVCGAASALLLALLDGLRARLTPLALRAAADLALLTPLALLLR